MSDEVVAPGEKVDDKTLLTLGDWNHLLPDDEWEKVVARAEAIEAARSAGPMGGPLGASPPILTPRYVDYPNSPYDKSGTLRRKQLWVIHTAETPLKVGYAQSLTEWADGDSYKPRVSWHRFVDPATVARFIKLTEAAWHANWANPLSIGYEQSGYARFERSVWMSDLGLRQISLLAQQIVKDGIPAAHVRRLSSTDVNKVKGGNTTIGGLCSHAQINPNNRTDPGAGYPWDVLIAFIKFFHPAFDDAPAPGPVTPTPIVQLVEDGKYGPATVRARQRKLGTVVDGIVSNQTYACRDANPGLKARSNWEFNSSRAGSKMIAADQRRLRTAGLYLAAIDGLAGPIYWTAIQKELRTTVDGVISEPSKAVLRMQQLINDGKY